jgi:hydrogenase small subunit
MLSLNYTEALSAGAGHSLELAKEQTIQEGGYLLFVEGAVMEGWDGNALRSAGEKNTVIIEHVATQAKAIFCVGSCAVDGGWLAAYPNPGGAIGVELYLRKALDAGRIHSLPPLINLPLCPANPEHILAVLAEYLLLNRLPLLTYEAKPKHQFAQTVHDNCPRRGHFENGAFVYEFGSEAERLNYCLYAVGCKGPQVKANCPIVRWNRRTSWCVESGAPCVGCGVATPIQVGLNWVESNAPFRSHLRNLRFGELSFDPTHLVYGVAGAVALAIVGAGFGMKLSGRTKGGVAYERVRRHEQKKLREEGED